MTVSYSHQIATRRQIGGFVWLLFKWRGSVYKLIWPYLLVFTLIYYSLSLIYRFALSAEQQETFEKLCLYFEHFSNRIPISFMLGFYVTMVVQRFWEQYNCLPWLDSLGLYVNTYIEGTDNQVYHIKRTIMRYVNISCIMMFRIVSPVVNREYPSLQTIVDEGILTESEFQLLEDVGGSTTHSVYWLPLAWASTLVLESQRKGHIRDALGTKTIVAELTRLRSLMGSILGFDWINISLVYTQVVTVAVYTFFLSALMGRQFLNPAKKYAVHDIDIYVPIFTYLEFFFYMGWLKVAESLINPFGADDDDFEISWLIKRNIEVGELYVSQNAERRDAVLSSSRERARSECGKHNGAWRDDAKEPRLAERKSTEEVLNLDDSDL